MWTYGLERIGSLNCCMVGATVQLRGNIEMHKVVESSSIPHPLQCEMAGGSGILFYERIEDGLTSTGHCTEITNNNCPFLVNCIPHGSTIPQRPQTTHHGTARRLYGDPVYESRLSYRQSNPINMMPIGKDSESCGDSEITNIRSIADTGQVTIDIDELVEEDTGIWVKILRWIRKLYRNVLKSI